MMTKKILFLHGLCFRQLHTCPNTKASICGQGGSTHSRPALHPNEALVFIENICQQEKPCVLVGNSNGAFLAQIVASRLGIPALLGNPYLEMTRFLIERIGKHDIIATGRRTPTTHFKGTCRKTGVLALQKTTGQVLLWQNCCTFAPAH